VNQIKTQEDTENIEKVSSEDMGVDTRKLHLSRKRPEESKEYEPEENKKAPRIANFEFPKGCEYVGTKAGPLSQQFMLGMESHGMYRREKRIKHLDPRCKSPSLPRGHRPI
jgi:hypothetical protein